MVIVQLAGGLGNQMFQYALCLQLKSLGKIVKMDDRTEFAQDTRRAPALALFGIAYEQAAKEELERMLDSSPLLVDKVRRKLWGRKKKYYFEEDRHYHSEILDLDDIYLEGYWQTEKYFEGIKEQVKEVYNTDRMFEYLTEHTDAENGGLWERWLERIASSESVSVHIRRSDYLLPKNQILYGGICTEAYYREAMQQMREEYPGCHFYLFTDDKQWVRQKMTGETDIEVVDAGESGDYAEFVLMSKCRHNILANSSFSWWASYLNQNQEKIVLAPEKWLNGWDCGDCYRDDMRIVKAKERNL